jgi:deoxyribodipyrimidine photolyase
VVLFGRKTDVEGAFVKHFVQDLEKFDQKYTYEPWEEGGFKGSRETGVFRKRVG